MNEKPLVVFVFTKHYSNLKHQHTPILGYISQDTNKLYLKKLNWVVFKWFLRTGESSTDCFLVGYQLSGRGYVTVVGSASDILSTGLTSFFGSRLVRITRHNY